MNKEKIEGICNVIDSSSMKERIFNVFNIASDTVAKSMGPFGAQTMLEQYGEMHITKDGWQLLKGLRFNNSVDNSLMTLFRKIPSQAVIQVGDGSSTSMVLARMLVNYITNTSLRPKELSDTLKKCVDLISKKVLSHSISIDKDGDYSDIYKIAYVSTNGDEEMSRIIQEIYKQTKGGNIKYVKSKTFDTHHEVLAGGYKLKNACLLSNIYVTSDDRTCEEHNVRLILFDHKIDLHVFQELINPIIATNTKAGFKTVVMAPFYDKILLDTISQMVQNSFNNNGTCPVIFSRCSLPDNSANDLYRDFSVICGAQIIQQNMVGDLMGKIYDADMYKSDDANATDSEIACKRAELKQEARNNARATMLDALGKVGTINIGEHTIVSGLNNINEDLLKKHIQDVNIKYKKALEYANSTDTPVIELSRLKERKASLECKLATIYVGGDNELEKKARLDLVEDAVKAVNSAFYYGYTYGQGTAVFTAIDEILSDYKEGILPCNKTIISMLEDIKNAYRGVIVEIFKNKYCNPDTPDAISDIETIKMNIHKVMNNVENEPENVEGLSEFIAGVVASIKRPWDLNADDFSNNIINPIMTDVEILKAASSIVGLLLSSNQFISLEIEGER